MVKETEIKLRVSPATLAALRAHPLLDGQRLSDWKRGELFNQYYDTASRALAGSKVALRLQAFEAVAHVVPFDGGEVEAAVGVGLFPFGAGGQAT